MNTSIDRRRFLGGVAAALTVSPISYCQNPAEKPDFEPYKPDTLFLTWQQDPTTTITMQWIGKEKEADEPVIRYMNRGKNDWVIGPVATKKPFPVVMDPKLPMGSGPEDLFIYRAELTGLNPGTEYEFRIGQRSPNYRFRTMPAKATKSFSFISGGDCGVNRHAVAVNKAAANQDPMFVMIGGDLGYDNGISGNTALQFIRNYSTTMTDSEGRLIPMVPAIGNHEVRGGFGKSLKDATFFHALFDGLYRETSYTTLDFGDYLSLVLLDSGHASPIAGEQTAWLAKVLAERAGKPHVIPVNHVPCYPSYRTPEGQAGKLGTGEEQRKLWVPLFERHEVDFVLEHHDHTFKRTRPLSGGKIDEATGVTYLGDGSWGQLRVPKSPEKRSYLEVVSASYHMTLHRLEGEQRFHISMGASSKVLDVYRTGRRARRRTPGVTT